jgi:hypothetical protein
MAKDEFIRVRVEPAVRKALEKEAQEQGRDLSNYVRRLIDTHPDRRVKKLK